TDPATGRPADEEEASGARMISLRVRQIEAGMRQAPTTFEHRTTFERAYPELADGVEDVHHSVPQVVQNRYPGRFCRAEVHSLANLRGIPVGRSQLHEELKLRWNMFYRGNPNATRQQILWRGPAR